MPRVGQAHPEAAKCDQSSPHYRFHLAVFFRLFGPVHAWYRDRDAYLQWDTVSLSRRYPNAPGLYSSIIVALALVILLLLSFLIVKRFLLTIEIGEDRSNLRRVTLPPPLASRFSSCRGRHLEG